MTCESLEDAMEYIKGYCSKHKYCEQNCRLYNEEIGKSKNHEISLENSFKFIDFYGLIDGCTLPANEGKRQFVGRCVLERLNKAFLDGEICIKAGRKNEID